MATFLFKTEPSDYSYADLEREGATVWDGVASNPALLQLRQVKKGDEALIYHTGKERRITGLAKVTSDPYPDPSQDDERLVVVDIKAIKPATKDATLKHIKADDRFKEFALVKQGRLSVMEVPAKLDRALREMAGL